MTRADLTDELRALCHRYGWHSSGALTTGSMWLSPPPHRDSESRPVLSLTLQVVTAGSSDTEQRYRVDVTVNGRSWSAEDMDEIALRSSQLDAFMRACAPTLYEPRRRQGDAA